MIHTRICLVCFAALWLGSPWLCIPWLCSSWLCSSCAYAGNGVQFWHELQYTEEVTAERSFFLLGAHRFREDLGEWWYAELGAGLSQLVRDRFTVAPTMSIIRLATPSDLVTTEYRPGLNFAFREQIDLVGLQFRVRNELRVRAFDEQVPQEEVYRLRLQSRQSFPLFDSVSGFLSQEVLYGSTSKAWEQLRFFAGVKLPPVSNLTPLLSWGIFSEKRPGSASFADSHVIQITFHF